MNRFINTLHIAVHLGGGAGKAIVGIMNPGDILVLLEKPQKEYWLNEAKQKGIQVIVEPSATVLDNFIRESDITIINWWGHPLMVQFMSELLYIPCRLVLYCHINGCVYPYLPFSFLNEFDEIMFTTPFSYENPLWTSNEREIIRGKSTVVYGMGDFVPREIVPRDSYEIRDTFKVGYIGTLNYAKLNPDFVKYCEAAADRIENIKFVLAGDIADDVKKDIERSSISDKFEHIGYVDNVEGYYKEIDVLGYLLNGYNFATTENVLLEAMAYATPIIALNQGVERHILEDGYSGYLIKCPEEYASIMYSLLMSDSKRKELGEAARKFCIEKYSCDDNKRRYDDVLHRCMLNPKIKHNMSCLIDKTPFEWLLFYSQKDKYMFSQEIEEVFLQDTKGSAFQFLKYYPEDMELKRICEHLSRKREEI